MRASGSLDQGQQASQALANSLREQVARLTEAWDAYRTRFEKVDQDLQTAFDKMSSGTQDQTRLFAERISLVDQHLGKAVDKLAVPVNQLSDDVESIAGSISELKSIIDPRRSTA